MAVPTPPSDPPPFDEPVESTRAIERCLADVYQNSLIGVLAATSFIVICALAILPYARDPNLRLSAIVLFGSLTLVAFILAATNLGAWERQRRVRKSPGLRRLTGPVYLLHVGMPPNAPHSYVSLPGPFAFAIPIDLATRLEAEGRKIEPPHRRFRDEVGRDREVMYAYLLDDAVTIVAKAMRIVLEISRTDGSLVYRQAAYASALASEAPKPSH